MHFRHILLIALVGYMCFSSVVWAKESRYVGVHHQSVRFDDEGSFDDPFRVLTRDLQLAQASDKVEQNLRPHPTQKSLRPLKTLEEDKETSKVLHLQRKFSVRLRKHVQDMAQEGERNREELKTRVQKVSEVIKKEFARLDHVQEQKRDQLWQSIHKENLLIRSYIDKNFENQRKELEILEQENEKLRQDIVNLEKSMESLTGILEQEIEKFKSSDDDYKKLADMALDLENLSRRAEGLKAIVSKLDNKNTNDEDSDDEDSDDEDSDDEDSDDEDSDDEDSDDEDSDDEDSDDEDSDDEDSDDEDSDDEDSDDEDSDDEDSDDEDSDDEDSDDEDSDDEDSDDEDSDDEDSDDEDSDDEDSDDEDSDDEDSDDEDSDDEDSDDEDSDDEDSDDETLTMRTPLTMRIQTMRTLKRIQGRDSGSSLKNSLQLNVVVCSSARPERPVLYV
ncbi:uncharacterized protein [Panulirus ornatus]|uniref:uncharacterized protein n=1 Tax=Panulirus ornatus TaxID=150431 RepID=UPI003A8890C4